MGIIDNDRYDAFFSYAHDDAKAFKGWLREFYDQLLDMYGAEIERSKDEYKVLESVIARHPDFFWDEKGLPANGDVGEELQKAIGKSEFLFVFIGKKYPKSDWCGKEVDWFFKRLLKQGKEEKEIYRRLFIILMEGEALGMSWGDAFLAKAKEKSLYQSFLDNEGNPIRPFLQYGNVAKENPDFFDSLRDVAETLVERTSGIILQPDIPTQPADSPSPPRRVRGVTIGAISPNLKNAAAELQKQLEDSGLQVERITLEDLNSTDADVKIKEALSKSAFFIQPFDYGKVLLPMFPGGHLSLQEQTIKSVKSAVKTAGWLVSSELGGIEATAVNAEIRELHIPYLENISKSAHKGEVKEVTKFILDLVGIGDFISEVALPTVFIENSKEDEKIMCLLADKLKYLWKDKYKTEPHLVCLAVPWNELHQAKEDTLKYCHGIIMIYGTKDSDALLAQIRLVERRLDPLSPNGINLGQAVAWIPPKTPRQGCIGYTLNFDCDPTVDELKVEVEEDKVNNFLERVLHSFRSD